MCVRLASGHIPAVREAPVVRRSEAQAHCLGVNCRELLRGTRPGVRRAGLLGREVREYGA